MKKYVWGISGLILLTVVFVVIAGIFVSLEEKQKGKEGDITLYYVSADGLSLYPYEYQFEKKGQTLEMVQEVLQQLKEAPAGEECQPSIPQEIIWSDFYLDKTNLIIDFTAEYTKLNSSREIFLRAGVVKTLTQLDMVRTVEFKVTGTPLMTLGNQSVGMMDADDFIDGSDENWGISREETTTLYFTDETGTKLVTKEMKLTVDNNIPMEQLIIEALIDTDKFYSPIPAGTTVLKTVTRDQICYVDLSEEFLNPMEKVSAEVTIYAIVNSLVERAMVNKVQFTVEGKTITNYRSGLDLSMPIGRNLDMIDK